MPKEIKREIPAACAMDAMGDGWRRIQNDTENFRVSQVAALRAALGLGRTKQEEKRLGFEMVQPIAAGS